MSVCTPAMNAVDRLLELLDQLEQVIVELRRQALDEDERGDL